MEIIASDAFINPLVDRKYHEKLTRQILIIKRLLDANTPPFTVIEKMHHFLDDALAFVYQNKTCARGCSYCCHIPVKITGLEARHIERRSGRKIKAFENGEQESEGRTPCPFLVNSECSIYEFRPMVCRTHLSFDHIDNCINEGSMLKMLALRDPGEGGFEWANLMYFNVMMHYLEKHPEYQVFNDIRGFFD